MLIVEKIAEEKIQEAIQKGEFKSLLLKGKLYQMDGYLYEDPATRLENKILRDHNLLPIPLEFKKRIECETEALDHFIAEFFVAYKERFKTILDLLGIRPPYPLAEYETHLDRHQRFVSVTLPLILRLRLDSQSKMRIHLFNRMIEGKREEYFSRCDRVGLLIDEYNREVVLATLKKRDMYRNFTTMGKISLKERKNRFLKLFPKISLTI
ncbi:MAG: hypothetical protein Kow0042_01980 [Calditrichia bacterium]